MVRKLRAPWNPTRRIEDVMRTVACAVCGSTKDRFLFWGRDRLHRNHRKFRVVQCRHCSLGYLNPQPELEELAAYYPEDYYSYSCLGTKSGFRNRLKERVKERWGGKSSNRKWYDGLASLYQNLCRTYPSGRPGRLLDIGCGSGEVLEDARKVGWDVAGVEPSRAACRTGKEAGLDIQCATAETMEFPPESFDCIRLNHTLEHVHDPRKVVRRCRALLKEGGTLLLAMPDFGSIQRLWFREHWFPNDVPRHLYHFTEKSLRMLLEPERFRVQVKRYCSIQIFLVSARDRCRLRIPVSVGLPILGGRWLNQMGLGDELVIRATRGLNS